MKVQKIRARAFDAQQGLCFYYGLPMIMAAQELQSFARKHGLKKNEARTLLATAEHLQARCEGGSDSPGNIVAAHQVCNARRHQASKPKSPDAYRSRVRSLCEKGKWHSPNVLRMKARN